MELDLIKPVESINSTRLEAIRNYLFNLRNEPVSDGNNVKQYDLIKSLCLSDTTIREFDQVISKYPEFFTSPASTKYHGNYSGGLFDHSIAVYYEAMRLMDVFGVDHINPLACILHDICKAGQYTEAKDKQGKVYYKYNEENLSIGHGEESLRRLFLCDVFLPERWQFAVRYHMGAFSSSEEERRGYGNACEKFKEVLLLHTADMMASKMLNI